RRLAEAEVEQVARRVAEARAETVAEAAEPASAAAPDTSAPSRPVRSAARAKRWILLHRAEIRTVVVGAISLALFLLAWHLLTKYRVNMHVRFTNVPSPAAVLEKFERAMHDTKFLMHVLLSCRRIVLGFLLAALIAIPLGLIMGRFRLAREMIFPVTEVLRPIPAIAWVPMSIMLWPSNEESIVFITFLGSFFSFLLNTLHVR